MPSQRRKRVNICTRIKKLFKKFVTRQELWPNQFDHLRVIGQLLMRNNRFSFIAVFVSGFFIWLGWGYYSKGAASEKWPVAQGMILESEVAESRKTRSGSGSRMYEARVLYEYEVEGQKIKGHQVSFMDGSSSNRSDAASVVSRLPIGKVVQVHYNPTDPYEACLSHGVGKIPWLMMGGGILGLGLSLKTLLFGNQMRRRREIHFS